MMKPHVAVEIDRKKLQPKEELAAKNEGKSTYQKVDEKTSASFLIRLSNNCSLEHHFLPQKPLYGSSSLIFREIYAEVFYRDEFLRGAFMNPFVQQPKETKLVSAAVVSSATVVRKKIVNAIVAERSRTGANLGFLSIVKS
ncbi:hypothetical protein L3X38_032125 [Prunus dulcis]|uniref:Uncharacterized protein n=1 Tax=Prunus dulcis TaxID=3755 RepID=A0AAD4VEI8_PRUDU|nr:hypothetical protein L3X38_032125 [Prunus dulcis]